MPSRIIVVAMLALLFTTCSHASMVDTYMAERSRILSQPYAERYAALQQSSAFDVKTLLGRYFYNTVYINTSQYDPLYTFSADELSQLKQTYPQIYYEHQVFTLRFSDMEAQQIISELEEIKLFAQQKHWQRIERWATSALVDVQIGAGRYYSAIINMQSVVSHAPHFEKTETTYDYPLVVIYRDMANALYHAGDYVKSYLYCQKYGDYLPNDRFTRLESKLCKARAEFRLKNSDNALVLVAQVMNEAREHNYTYVLTNSYTFAARIHLDQGQLDLAKSYALEGLDYAQQVNHKIHGEYFYFYYVLASVYALKGDPQKAQDYYHKMLEARGPLEHDLPSDKMVMTVELQLAELRNNKDEIIALYKRLLDNRERMQDQELAWKEFSTITDRLDEKQLSLLRVKSQLDRTQSNNMTLLAIVTSTFSLVGLLLVGRLWQQKRRMESFSRMDQLTGVPNRWHATELIEQKLNSMHRRNDPFCLALIDVDHFKSINDSYGHDVGDAALIHLAKLFKYQIREEDVFGRYGGEEFILYLSDVALADAEKKLAKLQFLLEKRPLSINSSEVPLRFSAGIIEVKSQADLTHLIAQCDTLLYRAKSRGRNRSVGGRYDHCAAEPA
ncbi:GGDEF domain-containing protein [Alteromonas aestuariivivens]|uniref:diguanylate cyclase n=1 Tax=Alteromonas aestuariivivens TaxID=1938339 RepID=A0A3D8M7L4_9ALTE|nr:GGDEF domain-containing protein [Alteromonas aestuariivivens]RDV25613.1 GGDEF domain-containing protein [Alteromonas aestuariivivens]